ncbi:MAG: hypothetical protein ACRED1_15930 [Limisphaerales bacterium]
MDTVLSEELRLFIKENITSLEQLEILLLLYQTPDRSWTIEEVFKVIQTNVHSVGERLGGLVSRGFLSAEGTDRLLFRFQPKSPDLARKISDLRKAYSLAKYKVIETIFSKPSDEAQTFADSFKLKRKP